MKEWVWDIPEGAAKIVITVGEVGGGGRSCGPPNTVVPHEGKAADIPPIDKSQDPTP